jgi:hypothetical protein
LQEKRDGLYFSFGEVIEQYKSSKGDKASTEKRKKIEADLKQVNGESESLVAELKPMSAESAEKVNFAFLLNIRDAIIDVVGRYRLCF